MEKKHFCTVVQKIIKNKKKRKKTLYYYSAGTHKIGP